MEAKIFFICGDRYFLTCNFVDFYLEFVRQPFINFEIELFQSQ